MPSRAMRREQERDQARRNKMLDARKERLRNRRSKARQRLKDRPRPQLPKNLLTWPFYAFLIPALSLGALAAVFYVSGKASVKPYTMQVLNAGVALLLIYMGATRKPTVPRWWAMATFFLGGLGLALSVIGILQTAGLVAK